MRELNLESQVHFAGEHVLTFNPHTLFDISVLPSTSEGFPNSIVESMAGGVPVVASRVGGIVDALDDGVTGLLFTPGDHVALGRALESLITDDSLRGRLLRRRARVPIAATARLRSSSLSPPHTSGWPDGEVGLSG